MILDKSFTKGSSLEDPLAAALEKFNRKERNLLIRDILGGTRIVPPISEEFDERLTKALQITPGSLKCAWWATDFHFDWLAGALLTFVKGKTIATQVNEASLIQGNQQDVDVIFAAHDPSPTAEVPHRLILMEAKAYGYFRTEQHRRKVARLDQLYDFYERLGKEPKHKIRFQYVLCSTKELPVGAATPRHVDLVHLKIDLPKRSDRLTVTRCDNKGKSDKEGASWKCT
jgi:hypothetical protein